MSTLRIPRNTVVPRGAKVTLVIKQYVDIALDDEILDADENGMTVEQIEARLRDFGGRSTGVRYGPLGAIVLRLGYKASEGDTSWHAEVPDPDFGGTRDVLFESDYEHQSGDRPRDKVLVGLDGLPVALRR